MKNYKIGFSNRGFISFMLVMVPNIIWMLTPPSNDFLTANHSINPVFNIMVNVSQWLMAALLCITRNKTEQNSSRAKLLIGLSVFCLSGYYISWILYHSGIINFWLFVNMAILPVIYFITIELWIKNYIALIPTIIFGVFHLLVTCSNFLADYKV